MKGLIHNSSKIFYVFWSSILLLRPRQLRVRQEDLIEGEFYLVKSKNYQAFLAAIGAISVISIIWNRRRNDTFIQAVVP